MAEDGGASCEAAMGNCRVFLTLCVLLFHAADPYLVHNVSLEQMHPLQRRPVDSASPCAVCDWVSHANRLCVLPCFFFVAGLFVWRSIERKGRAAHLCGRSARLLLPFLFGVVVMNPFGTFAGHLAARLVLKEEPVGPLKWWSVHFEFRFPFVGPYWTLWLLQLFDWLAVAIHCVVPGVGRWREALRGAGSQVLVGFWPFCVLVLAMSVVTYVPLTGLLGTSLWVRLPLTWLHGARACTLGWYCAFYLLGVVVGAWGLRHSALRLHGPIAERWAWLCCASGLLWAVWWRMYLDPAWHLYEKDPGWPMRAWAAGTNTWLLELVFCACSTCWILALLALAVRFWPRRTGLLDWLGERQYALYVFHEPLVHWIHYLLLDVPCHGALKFLASFLLDFAASLAPASLLTCWGRRARTHKD